MAWLDSARQATKKKGSANLNAYKWAAGSVHKVKAETAGAVCQKLAKEGKLNAKELVEVSRPKDAPLHKEFEWNNKVAAEKYRETQAAAIIRHLVVEVDEVEQPVRVFYPVEKEKGGANYENIEVICKSRDSLEILLEHARAEMNAFIAKYNTLEAYIGTVLDAMRDSVEETGELLKKGKIA